jgi:threonyl-tRNA synthetase
MEENNVQLQHLRHSLAHLLAAAVLEFDPQAKRGIGPAIENGFYYDFELSMPIGEADLPKIEQKMRRILSTWKAFERREVTVDEARAAFHSDRYKQELIDEYASQGLTIYKSGNYEDLCRGGHVENPQDINPDAFKLTHTAGAYWRGSEKNPMLTRIYGVAFQTKEELEQHLRMLEEAQKRDHKKLGPRLGLFMFHETAVGMPYWLPNGMTLLNQLIEFWRSEHASRGYQEISSPLINRKELWEISGHWEHYKEDMFVAAMSEHEVYGVKPMNCPNAMIVFGSELRSYRDLPLRLSDTDILHRYERSGSLNGLFRVRSFRQDDSHNFITEDQIEEEYGNIFEIAERFYGIFGLKYRYRLGTRPKEFLGDAETWDKAEGALKRILDAKVDNNYVVGEGEGAFYGPKVDILMKDALGREWQMGTMQLDFQLPRRFNLSYIDRDGQKKTPIVIHRVIYGSLDRFIGILIEHFAGAFPLWLSPVQLKVVPVSERHVSEGKSVSQRLRDSGLRAEFDDTNETLGKKIRSAEVKKVPYIVVIGDKEIESQTLAIRRRGEGDIGKLKLGDFVERLRKEIEQKSL